MTLKEAIEILRHHNNWRRDRTGKLTLLTPDDIRLLQKEARIKRKEAITERIKSIDYDIEKSFLDGCNTVIISQVIEIDAVAFRYYRRYSKLNVKITEKTELISTYIEYDYYIITIALK